MSLQESVFLTPRTSYKDFFVPDIFKKRWQDSFKLLKKTHDISIKKNSFLENEIKAIQLFISNNLERLTSSLDLNINAHLELIEQVSDHSIDIQTSSKKIHIKLRSTKNIRKKFTFFENKIFCFIWISFIFCYFL